MRLALVAHDEKKADLVATGRRLQEETVLDVERNLSRPQGGDLQTGAAVAEGDCHGIVFFRDPLTAQPHEPDVTALLRICDVHDGPLATNRSSADAIVDAMTTG